MAATVELVRVLFSTFLLTVNICSVIGQPGRGIPLNKWKELSDVKRNQDFIYGHVDSHPPAGVNLTDAEKRMFQNAIAPGFNPAGVEIIAGQVAEPEGCVPQDRSVAIPPSSNASIIRWPTCTKIQQCGGCCGTDMLECTPTRTESLTVEVMKVVYTNSGNFEFVGLEGIILQKHLECDCQCRIKPQHCNPQTQEYNEQGCYCRCRNEHEATSCQDKKIWSEKECACVCPRILHCLDDEFFSYSTCSCEKTSAGATSASRPLLPDDRCRHINCRAGYAPIYTGTTCACRIQQRKRARATGVRSRQWSRGSSDFDETMD